MRGAVLCGLPLNAKTRTHTYNLTSLDPLSVDFCSLQPRVPQGNTSQGPPLPSAFLSLHSVSLDDLIQTQAFIMSKRWWHACPTSTTPTLANVYSMSPLGYPIDPSIQTPFFKWFVFIHFVIVCSVRNIRSRTLNIFPSPLPLQIFCQGLCHLIHDYLIHPLSHPHAT